MVLAFKYNKHVLMTVISIIGTAMASGFPTTLLQLEVFGITVLGIMLAYIPKDFFFPSNSPHAKLNWRDYASATFMGISSGCSVWAASAFTASTLDWKSLCVTSASITSGYLFKLYKSCNQDDLNQLNLKQC